MVTIVPPENDWSSVFQNLGSGLVQGYTQRADEMALRNALQDLGQNASPRDILNAIVGTTTYSPQAKQTALQNYLGVQQFEELQKKNREQQDIAKEKNRIAALGKPTEQEKIEAYNNYIARGYDVAEAKAMTSPYVTDAAKQNISKHVEDEIARGKRANVTVPKVQTEATETPKEEIVNKEVEIPVAPTQDEQAWPILPEPQDMKPAELVKWRSDNHKFNTKELKDLRSKNAATQDALIHYSRLQQLNDTGNVQNGLGRLLIDPDTNEPYKNVQKLSGVNKETQQYIKTLNDFISQAKNFFGARVTNFDLQSFKSRLPSLLNTEEGRRAIIEQMRLMTELQQLHDNELSEGIKSNKDKSYIDIVSAADNKITKKEQNIINKINNLDAATKYLDMLATRPKYKDMQLMFNPSTNDFIAVRPGDIKALENKGYELWRSSL